MEILSSFWGLWRLLTSTGRVGKMVNSLRLVSCDSKDVDARAWLIDSIDAEEGSGFEDGEYILIFDSS